MSEELQKYEPTSDGVIAIMKANPKSELVRIQKFQNLVAKEPPKDSIGKTPDSKARTVYISFIETTLDELFFGQWSTQNFHWQIMANEVVGSLELVIIHPITGREIRRTGAASITVQVDRVPDSIKDDPRLRNQWALDVANKKPSALDMGFPKLKAECTKNAAQSLGRIFGRDLNRQHADIYNPLLDGSMDEPRTFPEPYFTNRILHTIDHGTPEDIEDIKRLITDFPIDEGQYEQIKERIEKWEKAEAVK